MQEELVNKVSNPLVCLWLQALWALVGVLVTGMPRKIKILPLSALTTCRDYVKHAALAVPNLNCNMSMRVNKRNVKHSWNGQELVLRTGLILSKI